MTSGFFVEPKAWYDRPRPKRRRHGSWFGFVPDFSHARRISPCGLPANDDQCLELLESYVDRQADRRG